MKPGGAFVGAVCAALAACGARGERRADLPDYWRPYGVVLTEYAVPVVMGVAARGTVGGWDDHITLRDWVRGWTHRPQPHDVDNGFVNYVLHPLAGSETHLIARNHGWNFGESFLFDAFGSLMWEYVFENVHERPSRIDLMVTAPAGALLGELRFRAKEAGFLPGLMDPLGDHGEPFLELSPEGLLWGIQQKF
jgi:hypothetical protein